MRDLRIRYWMVLLATLVAVLLYLDRICLSTAMQSIEKDLGLNEDQRKWVLAAFYWTYAAFQLPTGWLGDRYGARWVLGAYVALWSLSTALMGFAGGITSLLMLRLACGAFEAGAYPVCAGIVRKWVAPAHRGKASSIVSVGGRLGGALAPIITIELMLWWTYGQPSFMTETTGDPSHSSWRPVMFLYGGAGLVIAAIFMKLYRDSPQKHPLVTPAELANITGTSPDTVPTSPSDTSKPANPAPPFPFKPIVTSLNLWLMCYVQFASNFGSTFLMTLMPRYLKDVHNISQQTQGLLQSLSLGAGIVGLLIGGWLTDLAAKRWGLRIGRSALLVASRGLVAIAFLACLGVKDAVQATIFLAMVGFATDLGLGATWAYGQDVGGKHVGSVMGWGNMWGNLGAALSPIILGWIAELFVTNIKLGWQFAFIFCAVIQFIAVFAALGVRANQPISQ